MLHFDLSDLLRTVGMSRVFDVDVPPFADEDVMYTAPLLGQLTVTNGGSVLLVRGVITTTVQLECARCLTDVLQPVRAVIEEQYSLSEVKSAMHHESAARVVQDDENEVPEGLFDGALMNFATLVRQAVILESPLNPLCRDECAGLCPRCGKNRNDVACACDTAAVKPFSALAELMKERGSLN